MNKCFIEYPNHKSYISFNDAFCYINLILGKRDLLYYFAQFVYQIKICYMVLSLTSLNLLN